ncbi:MAG: hypothetical protein R3E99_19095 [Burkholderiaceae bacterium]
MITHQNITRWLTRLGLLLALGLAGCAAGPRLVPHGFNFDGWYDGWAEEVDLLEYAYGDAYEPVRGKVRDGKRSAGGQSGVFGSMPVGEFLYVKWRIKATGEVLEDKVDLRDRLPRDMSDHELTFLIDGRQLYAYIVTPRDQAREVRQRTHKTWLSRYNVVYEIYPENEIKGER